jgi:hypothetical protein
MKNQPFLLSLLFTLLGLPRLFAQQATVIDPSYMTVPRYANEMAISAAIATPQQGMLVYNIATQSYWFRNASAWTNLAAAVSGSQWTTTGNDIRNNNSGSIGIGVLPGASPYNATLNISGGLDKTGIYVTTSSTRHPAGSFAGDVYGIEVVGGHTGGYFTALSPSGYSLYTGNGKIELNGFTKIGAGITAPSIQTKKLTGTTPNSMNPGTWTFVAHGIANASKILSISVIVTDGTYQYLPHSSESGILFTVNVDGGTIAVGVKDIAKSGTVMNKPIKILIVYEE